jgi:hypothetical protein
VAHHDHWDPFERHHRLSIAKRDAEDLHLTRRFVDLYPVDGQLVRRRRDAGNQDQDQQDGKKEPHFNLQTTGESGSPWSSTHAMPGKGTLPTLFGCANATPLSRPCQT